MTEEIQPGQTTIIGPADSAEHAGTAEAGQRIETPASEHETVAAKPASYTVEVLGLMRNLPLFQVAPGVRIAIFNMLGDTELVEAVAHELAERLPDETEVFVTPEVKSIPLAHALSVHTHLPYVVARKVLKPYMLNPIQTEVTSITTGQPQTLYIDGKDRALLDGRKVVLIDDVISTGSTLNGLRQLMNLAGAEVISEMAVFTEGDPDAWPDVVALGNLPILEG